MASIRKWWKALRQRRATAEAAPTAGKIIRIPAPVQAGASGSDIAIAAIFKNERPYVREWVDYHKLIGVKKFYLYDNQSDDGTQEELRPELADGSVEIIPWPHFQLETNTQAAAYAHAIANTAGRHAWLAILDLDEFLVPCGTQSLAQVLAELKHCPQVLVYWFLFGPNGHKTMPAGGVIRSYTERQLMPFETNAGASKKAIKHKFIIQPHLAREYVGSHHAGTTHLPVIGYNDKAEPVTDPQAGLSATRLRIHHYFTKSEAELAKKINSNRVAKQGETRSPERLQAILNGFNSDNCTQDDTIIRLVDRLKAKDGHDV